ncbi:MAG: hypothetical protein V1253_07375, partial [Alphaproteobacteria bacterium]|nr:hypothetical protein [Alphaproteobacteria bacterium]
MPKPRELLLFSIVLIFSLSLPLPSIAGDPVVLDRLNKAVVDDGKLILNARFRYEFVDQDSRSRDANAVNLRTRFGYETGYFYGFGFGFDVENVHAIGDDRYNSTINGRSDFPTVVDPEDTELNQLFLKFGGKEAFI